MNLKKSLVSAVAGLALIGSIAAPIASAQTVGGSDSASAELVLTDGGVFNIDIVGSTIALTPQTIDVTTTGLTSTGTMDLEYTDTKSYRGAFSTTVTATNFTGPVAGKIIPATGFKIMSMPNPIQQNWSGNAPGTGSISNMEADGVHTNTNAVDWSPGVALSTSPKIHQGWAGSGTVTTTAKVNLSLDVPNNIPAGTYSSTITVTVTGAQP